MVNLSLVENVKQVKEKIRQACLNSGREMEEVHLITVTKYVNLELTKEALDIGMQHIGENRVKEGTLKYEALGDRGVWHFIGSLQTRKVKDIIEKFDYIHSLDRLSLAKEIDKRAREHGIKVKCFIQVNVSGEETKSGITPEDLFSFLQEIKNFDSIQPVGLMTMAPHTDDKELIRGVFRKLKNLLEAVNQKQILPEILHELSMGMSNDFEIAIEEGATHVRLGSILFKS